MNRDTNPTIKDFLHYMAKVLPCLLMFALFYCIVHCYSYDSAVVVIPLGASFVVLYTFFGNIEDAEDG
ncbi:MAG: hypothetical protein AB1341_04465 [Bacillota bacterium]